MTLTDPSGSATGATPEPRTWRVLLVDSQRIFRQALRILLAPEPQFLVVGEAATASEALGLLASHRPEVVITDLHLRDGGGVGLVAQLHARCPQAAILVLTAVRAHDVAASLRKAGARGYLLKDEGRGELLNALRAIVADRCYRSSPPPVRAPRTLLEQRSQLSTRAAYLTERQLQVLRSVALGHQAREIAQMLGVSVRAVYRHRERLRIALHLEGTAALTRFAVREGFAEEGALSR
jgi:DNA-binding NarL/FixJ family response regulator